MCRHRINIYFENFKKGYEFIRPLNIIDIINIIKYYHVEIIFNGPISSCPYDNGNKRKVKASDSGVASGHRNYVTCL